MTTDDVISETTDHNQFNTERDWVLEGEIKVTAG